MTEKMPRRDFLQKTAGAVSAALPLFIPATALGRAGRIPPSQRIVMGSIGVGTAGFADMNAFKNIPEAQVVAACDVKRAMRERAKQAVDAHYGNTDCTVYNDFRELLDRTDIDAVSIATLDSWHVLHALAAVRAGKDVYVEKPLGMSIGEIKVLRDAVHRYRSRSWGPNWSAVATAHGRRILVGQLGEDEPILGDALHSGAHVKMIAPLAQAG